jgi:hypothetical protein
MRPPEFRSVAAVDYTVNEHPWSCLEGIIADAVANFTWIVKIKGIIRKWKPGMIGNRDKSVFQFVSELIYDQTSVIASASRKVGEHLADHKPVRRIRR